MALLDLIGRRWSLRVIWELRERRLPFRALRDACGGVSPSVLNLRLKELRESHIVDMDGEGYGLTPMGQQFRAALHPLIEWSNRWAKL
jgi:DNA-binding HxlR family transcriptional regulator